MKTILLIVMFSFLGLLEGCATTPEFDTQGVNRRLTPMMVASNPKQAVGQTVIWGGLILSTRNLTDHTQLEILAYPLDSSDRPEPDAEPGGRFLLNEKGYLESAEYTVGRYISVRGHITGTRKGKIGETEYLYPILEAEQLFLWSRNFEAAKPRVHFGIGVIIGR
jgi:outer membrane lipoprotein